MTQDLLLDASRAFFGQVTKLDARRARLTLMQANARYRLATVSVRYGVREFRVEIDRYRNTIRLSEITVHRRLGFDRRQSPEWFCHAGDRACTAAAYPPVGSVSAGREQP